MHGRLRQRDVAAQLRLVQHLPQAMAGGAHQTPEDGQCRDRRDLLEVALEIRADVTREPGGALVVCLHVDRRRRIAAAARERTPVFCRNGLRGDEVEPVLVVRGEELVPDAGAAEPELLAPGHRPQREVARTAGEALGDLAHQQEIRRSGQDEPAFPAADVDRALDGAQQRRMPLYLVDRQAPRAADQVVGRGRCLIEDVEIVERQVQAVVRPRLDERALAGLPGARDDDRGHRVQRAVKGGLHVTGEGLHRIHALNDNHSTYE